MRIIALSVSVALLAGCAATPESAVYSAASSGNLNALKGAMRLAADTSWDQCGRGRYGGNALLTAVSRDFYSGTRYLLQQGANPNVRCQGVTALHLAAQGNDPTSTKILLEYNANPNIRDDHGRTPVFYASYNIAKKLLNGGAQVRIRDEDGSTPMMFALKNGKNTAQLLEKHGADRRSAQAAVSREKASDTDMFDLVMKTAVTASVAGTVAASNIDAYHGADIISATTKDLWIEGESGNLARLNEQYNEGDFSIQDASIAASYQQQQDHEAAIQQIQQKARQEAEKRAAEKRAAEQRAAQAKAQMAKRLAEQQREQQVLAKQQRQEAERQEALRQEARKAQQAELERKKREATSLAEAKAAKSKMAEASRQSFRENRASYKLGTIKAGKDNEISGELTRKNIQVGNTRITSLTVRYSLDDFMQEPTVSGSWKWTSSDAEASLPSGFAVWLKVANGSSYGYVRIAPALPEVNGDFGYNGPASSPNWDSYICSFSGSRETDCIDGDLAKKIYKGGRVTGFEVSHR